MMTRLMITLAATAAAAAGFVALPAPAQAQNSVGEVIVYGNDPCPRSTDDQVVVCARRPETERYRIPEPYQRGATFQERQSWVNKARTLQIVGATGIGSCSAVGPGGYTGCLTQEVDQAFRDRRQQTEQATPPEE
jgi:hypothetical protein